MRKISNWLEGSYSRRVSIFHTEQRGFVVSFFENFQDLVAISEAESLPTAIHQAFEALPEWHR